MQKQKRLGLSFSKGFTIIELIVVIAIIAILAAITIFSVNKFQAKARDAVRKGSINEIQKALEMYYAVNSSYPNSGWACSNNLDTDCANKWVALQTALEPYLSKLPVDPINENIRMPYSNVLAYGYYSSGYGCPGQWYLLVYGLENKNIVSPGAVTCDSTSPLLNWQSGKTITVGQCKGTKCKY